MPEDINSNAFIVCPIAYLGLCEVFILKLIPVKQNHEASCIAWVTIHYEFNIDLKLFKDRLVKRIIKDVSSTM